MRGKFRASYVSSEYASVFDWNVFVALFLIGVFSYLFANRSERNMDVEYGATMMTGASFD